MDAGKSPSKIGTATGLRWRPSPGTAESGTDPSSQAAQPKCARTLNATALVTRTPLYAKQCSEGRPAFTSMVSAGMAGSTNIVDVPPSVSARQHTVLRGRVPPLARAFGASSRWTAVRQSDEEADRRTSAADPRRTGPLLPSRSGTGLWQVRRSPLPLATPRRSRSLSARRSSRAV